VGCAIPDMAALEGIVESEFVVSMNALDHFCVPHGVVFALSALQMFHHQSKHTQVDSTIASQFDLKRFPIRVPCPAPTSHW
jgi:hypothetical protein